MPFLTWQRYSCFHLWRRRMDGPPIDRTRTEASTPARLPAGSTVPPDPSRPIRCDTSASTTANPWRECRRWRTCWKATNRNIGSAMAPTAVSPDRSIDPTGTSSSTSSSKASSSRRGRSSRTIRRVVTSRRRPGRRACGAESTIYPPRERASPPCRRSFSRRRFREGGATDTATMRDWTTIWRRSCWSGRRRTWRKRRMPRAPPTCISC
mmetsp:Transcript_2880/g.6274  ORF Transcript_2880/g.6274 Transcript_2880/m.6274 type:complete len:209 (-) Transcript_2880:1966-2592(-)